MSDGNHLGDWASPFALAARRYPQNVMGTDSWGRPVFGFRQQQPMRAPTPAPQPTYTPPPQMPQQNIQAAWTPQMMTQAPAQPQQNVNPVLAALNRTR